MYTAYILLYLLLFIGICFNYNWPTRLIHLTNIYHVVMSPLYLLILVDLASQYNLIILLLETIFLIASLYDTVFIGMYLYSSHVFIDWFIYYAIIAHQLIILIYVDAHYRAQYLAPFVYALVQAVPQAILIKG